MDSHHDNPLNRRACCFDISGEWFLRAVSRRGLPLIGRVLCYLSLEMAGGGRDRTGAWAAYEAAAFPLGYPAVGKWWVVPVTLRRRPSGRLFYRQLTVFT